MPCRLGRLCFWVLVVLPTHEHAAPWESTVAIAVIEGFHQPCSALASHAAEFLLPEKEAPLDPETSKPLGSTNLRSQCARRTRWTTASSSADLGNGVGFRGFGFLLPARLRRSLGCLSLQLRPKSVFTSLAERPSCGWEQGGQWGSKPFRVDSHMCQAFKLNMRGRNSRGLHSRTGTKEILVWSIWPSSSLQEATKQSLRTWRLT